MTSAMTKISLTEVMGMQEKEGLQEGKVYEVTHSRKGTFRLRLTGIGAEWLRGTVVAGMAHALLPENRVAVGEVVDMKRSLVTKIERVRG